MAKKGLNVYHLKEKTLGFVSVHVFLPSHYKGFYGLTDGWDSCQLGLESMSVISIWRGVTLGDTGSVSHLQRNRVALKVQLLKIYN